MQHDGQPASILRDCDGEGGRDPRWLEPLERGQARTIEQQDFAIVEDAEDRLPGTGQQDILGFGQLNFG